jgi:hypothetical protein
MGIQGYGKSLGPVKRMMALRHQLGAMCLRSGVSEFTAAISCVYSFSDFQHAQPIVMDQTLILSLAGRFLADF